MGFGAFGDNFTVAGLTEANVRIDDTWRVGQKAVIQVSQPRQLCWKLARRWRIKSLALQVQQTGRTGWYDHVLQRGVVSAGITLVLKNRPHPEWTVQHANLRIAVALAGYKADNGEYPDLSANSLRST